MIYTWLDLTKKYVVKHEGTGKRVSIGGIRELIKKDEDYLLEITTKRGSIYRYDLEGEVWAVYIKPSRGGNKIWSLWRDIEDLGAEKIQEGDSEAVFTFSSELLDDVAEVLNVRKRHTRKKRKQ